jgi:tetratricopeptide (TPR) repeat protein
MKIPRNVHEAARNSKFQTGLDLLLDGKHRDSISYFDQAIREYPYNAAAWCWRGRAMFSIDNLEECIVSYDNGIKLQPQYGGRYREGLTLEKESNFQSFVHYFSKGVDVPAPHMESWYRAGVGMCILGNTQRALHCFDMVIKIEPKHFEAWCHRGGLLGISGWHQRPKLLICPPQVKEAIAAYDRALAIRRDPIALVNRGRVMIRGARRKAAFESFDQATTMEPKYGDAWLHKGILLVRMRKRREADECFKKALGLYPNYAKEYARDIDEWRPGPFEWD